MSPRVSGSWIWPGLPAGVSGMGFNPAWESRNYTDCINQFNTGVLAFRRDRALDMLASWQKKMDDHVDVKCDQPAFRAALLESGLPYGPLSASYNFMATNRAEIVVQKVKFVHFVGKKGFFLDGKTRAIGLDRYRKINRYSVILKRNAIYGRNGVKLGGLV